MKINLDIFPAHLVAVPAGFTEDVTELTSSPATPEATYLNTTRVVIAGDQIFVAIDSNTGPVIAFKEKIAEFIPGADKNAEQRVVTESGKMLAFRKDNNCGCGSRLRGWNPYNTLNSIKD